MQLVKGQYVIFENGARTDFLDSRWSEKSGSFYTFDEEGNKLFSNEIVTEKASAKKAAFIPSAKNCIVKLRVMHETDKAYAIEGGWNGLSGRNSKVNTKYIAKSVCYIDENGDIYAPLWSNPIEGRD